MLKKVNKLQNRNASYTNSRWHAILIKPDGIGNGDNNSITIGALSRTLIKLINPSRDGLEVSVV